MDSGFSRSWLDELLARADIMDVVSPHVRLKKNGHRYFGVCPFHNEKTASFCVNPEQHFFHCFGCGKGGDAITFTMEFEHCGFSEAVKLLADRFNVMIPNTNNAEYNRKKSERDRWLLINKTACEFYAKQLYANECKTMLDYLKKRGITDTTIRLFKIGAASDSHGKLTSFLVDKGFSLDELHKIGLSSLSNGSAYDVYRNRIIFPILNVNGDIIGFGGRAIQKNSKSKYINTRETPVYTKGNGVYGANLLKKMKSTDKLVIVEGYFDVISLSQQGLTGVVATLGTAITKEQARLLKKYRSQVYVAYDGDKAGQAAVLTAISILSSEDISVKVIQIPDNQDPDDFVKQHGIEAFNKLTPLTAYQFRMLQKQTHFDLSNRIEAAEYAKACVEIIKEINDPIDFETHLAEVALQTGLSQDVLRAQIGTVPSFTATPKLPRFVKTEVYHVNEHVSDSERTQKALIALLLTEKISIDSIPESIFTSTLMHSLYTDIKNGLSHYAFLEKYTQNDREEILSLMMDVNKHLDREDVHIMAAQCINKLKIIEQENRINYLKDVIQSSSNKGGESEILSEIMVITEHLVQLKSVTF